MAHLRHLPELELLILQHTAITDDGLAFLEKLKHLKSLVLWDNNTGDGALAHIAALRRLESLNLGKTKVTDAGIAHLQHSTQLRVLLLSNTNITDRGLESIAHLRQLEQLHLDGTQVRGPGLGSLTCSNLSTLFLHGCPIDDEGLKHLKRFPNLQSLTLADTKVKGEGLVHLADHEHLTSLQLGDLQGLVESAPSIRDAGGLPHVNSLSVVDGRLDAETVDALRVFPKLAYLNFSRTTFTDSGLERLTSFSIRGLSVFDAAVSDEQVKHLAKLKTLESLDLLGARISVEGTEQLERKLPNARIVPSSVELRVLNQVNAIGKDRNAKSQ